MFKPVNAVSGRPLRQLIEMIALSLVLAACSVGSARAATPGGNVGIVKEEGFDTCDMPTTSELSTWSAGSPYGWVLVYMGGNNFGGNGCDNSNVNASWVSNVDSYWWQMPMWVSYQAPYGCAVNGDTYGSYMSADADTAYTQGYDSAYSAETAAKNLGYKSGSIIFDDMEAYQYTDSSCSTPVDHFVNGWCWRLSSDGWSCGMYGSSVASGVSDWAYGISNPPNDIYAAQWNGKISAWGLAGLSDSSDWNYDQRAHQYLGGVSKTWNNLTLNPIDVGCAIARMASSCGWTCSEDKGETSDEAKGSTEDANC